jgi:hypothetical protein
MGLRGVDGDDGLWVPGRSLSWWLTMEVTATVHNGDNGWVLDNQLGKICEMGYGWMGYKQRLISMVFRACSDKGSSLGLPRNQV